MYLLIVHSYLELMCFCIPIAQGKIIFKLTLSSLFFAVLTYQVNPGIIIQVHLIIPELHTTERLLPSNPLFASHLAPDALKYSYVVFDWILLNEKVKESIYFQKWKLKKMLNKELFSCATNHSSYTVFYIYEGADSVSFCIHVWYQLELKRVNKSLWS